MKYIHHYTTIDNLALILESKKIRFARLDLLDDIKEVAGLDNPIEKIDKSIFISSWTEDNEENIPLWKMYASITNGIRITMPQDMFQKNLFKAFAQQNHGMTVDMYSPFTKEEIFYNGKYQIINIFDSNREDFYKKVKYRDDFMDVYQSLIKRSENGIEIACLWDLGKFKSKKWKFQKEVRFTIYTKVLNPAYSEKTMQQYGADNIRQWYENPDKYIDVSLSDEAFKNMTITLAPCATDAQRVIVKSLIHTYGLHNEFKESDLRDTIRK